MVVGVIGILATMGLFAANKSQAAARDAKRVQIMTSVQSALERYYGDKLTYPVVTLGGAQWGSLIFILTLATPPGPYLSTAPQDPCNGGVAIVAEGYPSTFPPNNVCPPARFWYDMANCSGSVCSGYSLTLTKESGGSQTFTNP